MKESVGILIIAKDTNNYLLLHRVEKPITWSILTGKMDVEGETPLQTVKREIQEEINLDPNKIKNIQKIGIFEDTKRFHAFIGYVDEEFTPNLNLEENDDFMWTNPENMPSPMHKRWPNTFKLVKSFLNLKEQFIRHTKSLL